MNTTTVDGFFPEAVPGALKEKAQWVVWKFQIRDGKRTKVPYSAITKGSAKSTAPETWATYAAAVEAFNAGGFDGVGYVFSADDGLTGIDLDRSLNEDGTLKPWARELYAPFADTYSEVSPSGTGIKLWTRAVLPGKGRKINGQGPDRTGKIEIYDRDRYFTVTGRIFRGAPSAIGDRQEAVTELYAKFTQQKKPAPAPRPGCGLDADDSTLIDKAKSATNGAKFAKLWSGDTSEYAGDDSSADLGLCNMLAFYCGPDHARIDRLFRQSGLYRQKWERTDYRERTISAALAGRTEFYDPQRTGNNRIGKDVAEEQDRNILNKKDPLPTARKFVADAYTSGTDSTLICSGSVFHAWTPTEAYRERDDAGMIAELYPWLERHSRWVTKGDNEKIVPFHPTKGDIDQTLHALRAVTYTGLTPPVWLCDASGLPPAGSLIVAPNGIIDLTDPRMLLAPTPRLFTLNALSYDFIPDAPEPAEWLSFLDTLWPDDRESIETLQEIFGYCLTADTRLQKIFLLYGPPRSGKGTIARILAHLLGMANVCAPTLAGLATNFGLWSLIGKLLAIVSDARLSGRTDQAIIVERLLSISGEDCITVDRKHLPPLTLKLPTRILILTNELPRLNDASGALANRFITLALEQSFLGREDIGLTDRLMGELSSILLWAIAGWKRLRQRGHFVQPTTGRDAMEEMNELSSPVAAFVRDWCEVRPGAAIGAKELFDSWRAWCAEQGKDQAGNAQVFGRDLRSAFPAIGMRRLNDGGERVRAYQGIDLTMVARATAELWRTRHDGGNYAGR